MTTTTLCCKLYNDNGCVDKYVGSLVYALTPSEFEGEGLIYFHGRIVPTLYLPETSPEASRCVGVVVAPPAYNSGIGAYFVGIQISGVCWVHTLTSSGPSTNSKSADLPGKRFADLRAGECYIYEKALRIFLLLREHRGLRVFIEPYTQP